MRLLRSCESRRTGSPRCFQDAADRAGAQGQETAPASGVPTLRSASGRALPIRGLRSAVAAAAARPSRRPGVHAGDSGSPDADGLAERVGERHEGVDHGLVADLAPCPDAACASRPARTASATSPSEDLVGRRRPDARRRRPALRPRALPTCRRPWLPTPPRRRRGPTPRRRHARRLLGRLHRGGDALDHAAAVVTVAGDRVDPARARAPHRPRVVRHGLQRRHDRARPHRRRARPTRLGRARRHASRARPHDAVRPARLGRPAPLR